MTEQPNSAEQWLPLDDAARRLGLSVEAVRMRLNRGKLRGFKRDGRWFVVLPTGVGTVEQQPERTPNRTNGSTTSRTPNRSFARTSRANTEPFGEQLARAVAQVDELRARVAAIEVDKEDMRRRLDHADREKDELRQLLAAAITSTRQLPEQTASSAPSTAPEIDPVDRLPVLPADAPSTPQRRAWWRFW